MAAIIRFPNPGVTPLLETKSGVVHKPKIRVSKSYSPGAAAERGADALLAPDE
jgi:hypothetical protein